MSSSLARRPLGAGLLLAMAIALPSAAQTVSSTDDGTTLEQVIVFGRHGVRAPTAQPATLATYAVDPYPDFGGLTPGYLTPHGRQAAALLGSYFRAYLLHERLLTGNAQIDLERAYFRANSIQRSNVTAASFGAGLIPGPAIPVHSFPLGETDAVFDPVGKGVAPVDPARAAVDVRGVLGSGAALYSAYSGERSLVRSVLFDYPLGTQPPSPVPSTPPGLVDAASQPFLLEAGTTGLVTGNIIDGGGLRTLESSIDPFVMEYTAGLPLEQVAWGRLSLDGISQLTRIAILELEIAMRSPYLARVQSSNAVSHVLRTMEQRVIGHDVPGAFGSARARVIVVVSSDTYVAGVAGLLGLHWALPGYQPDFCAPGGALVFELRRSRRPREHVVRAYYTAQGFDQLRNLTPLTLQDPPQTQQLLIPVETASGRDSEAWSDGDHGEAPAFGHEGSAASLDVRFEAFQRFVRKVVDRRCVEDPRTEVPPGVLSGVPLS